MKFYKYIFSLVQVKYLVAVLSKVSKFLEVSCIKWGQRIGEQYIEKKAPYYCDVNRVF